MLESSLHPDSYTEAENVFAAYLGRVARLRESRAALKKNRKKRRRMRPGRVEGRGEAKLSQKMPPHEHLELSNLWLPKIGLMVNEWLNLYDFRL